MNKKIAQFAAGFFSIVLILFLFQRSLTKGDADKVLLLESGWSVAFEEAGAEEIERNQDIDAIKEIDVARGAEIAATHMLPEMGDLAFPTLLVETRYSALRVEADGEEIYTAYLDRFAQGDYIGSGPHLIDLPQEYAGRLITIYLIPSVDRAFTGLSAPILGDHDDVARYYDHRVLVSFCIGLFMMMYGLISMIVMAAFYIYLRKFETQIAASVMSVDLGLWIVFSTQLQTHLLSGSQTAVMYATQYLVIPLLYGYLALLPKKIKGFRIVAIASSALSLLFILLHLIGVARINAFLVPFSVVAFIGAGIVIYYDYRNLQQRRIFSSDALQTLGITGMGILIILNVVFTILQDMIGLERSVYMRFFFPLGAAFYVMTQIFQYYLMVTDADVKHGENEVLFKVAYEDALTGLYNRAGWDEKMKEIDQSGVACYIISLDLDGLKAINDTKGHAAGDKLIKGFAQILDESFRDPHFISRIGGDEFCVIMENVEEDDVKKCLERLDTKLGVWDRKEKSINHRCSYGYAIRAQDEKNAHETYLEADAKMYEMKSLHKVARKADALTRNDSAEVKVAQMVEETLAEMREAELAQGKPETMSQTQALVEVAKTTFDETQSVTLEREKSPRSYQERPLSAMKSPPTQSAPRVRQPRPMTKEAQQAQIVRNIQESEFRQAAKDAKVKKALKTLQEAQGQQSGGK